MKKFRVSPVLKAVLVLMAAAIVLLVALIVGVNQLQQAGRRAQRQVDITNYIGALLRYSNAFGALPAGDNSVVTPALTGANPRQVVFWRGPVNERGEFVDPLRRPYLVSVTSNLFSIREPSPR
jgi:hypothetical protein